MFRLQIEMILVQETMHNRHEQHADDRDESHFAE